MGLIKSVLGPRSKYDKTLPYTYMARSPVIEGDTDIYNYYFADTICGLIEYLDEKKIQAGYVEIFGCYLKEEKLLDISVCIDKNGQWLKKPFICKAMEAAFKKTMKSIYKGHLASSRCSFDDRDRQGSGPF